MPTPTITKMGKVKGPAFVDNLTNASPVKKKNAPILILIVGGGVAAIWYLRSHSSANTVGSTTNPAVSINGGSAPDQSTIDNLTASVLALQGLQNGNTTAPGGGTSTPITPTPVTTTPAAASVASMIAAGQNPNYVAPTATPTTPQLAFNQANASAIDAAYARFTVAETAALTAAGKPAGLNGAERGSLPVSTQVALANSVGAGILTKAGYFGAGAQ